MAKKISKRAVLGDRGIALIHDRVLEMGFLWHQRGGLEAGIDGEIELRDPVTEEVLNRVILVQSKASGRFDGEDEESFHYYCSAADRDYWLQSNVPVLLVCSHPESGEAWWVCIQSWFSTPERLESTRINFDKRRDRFDRDAAGELMELGGGGASRGYLPALPKTETLLSNLLPIERIPELIFPRRRIAAAVTRHGSGWRKRNLELPISSSRTSASTLSATWSPVPFRFSVADRLRAFPPMTGVSREIAT